LTAFAGPSALYALDTQRGLLADADPLSLAARGQPISLSAKLSAGGATLDDAGRLWVIDNATGDLTRIKGSTRTTHRGATKPGRSVLTLVNGNPVVVDPANRTASTIDAGTGEPGDPLNLDIRPDDTISVSGSPHADRLYVVVARGVLTICDLRAASCDKTIPLDAATNDLGAAVEAGNRVFVPDYTTGRVWIIDLAHPTVIVKPQVLNPPGKFQLLARDGIVFYNDPNTERAGVIRVDGGIHPVVKYDPRDPSKGLNSPPSVSAAPATTTNPSPATDTTAPPAPTTATQPPPTGTRTEPTTVPLPTRIAPLPTTSAAPPPPNPPPPPPKPILRITLSKAKPAINESLALQVNGSDGATPVSARWDFGDATAADGTNVTHSWATAKIYQVSVQATMADGQQATTSLGLEVTPPPTVTTPGVVGMTEANAKTAITNANLLPVVTKIYNNTVPLGVVISQSPPSGSKVAPQSQIQLNVSSGKRAPVDFIARASGAAWRSGAGALPFPGPDNDTRGFALIRNGVYQLSDGTPCRLEDGTAPTYLETHPEWVASGYVEGTYTLPAPIIAGDHFRAKIGFIRCAVLAGDAYFSVTVIRPNGTSAQVANVHDIASDDIMPLIDVDLTPYVGSTKIALRVTRNGNTGQPWATWAAPRVEG
jgi:hypothetical protein